MSKPVGKENGKRPPMALLESFSIGEFSRSFKFEELESVVEASTPDQVIPVFREIEAAVSRGRHAVGFVAYGAATALNPELSVQESSELPLVWFGVFRNRRPADRTTEPEAGNTQLISQPELEITREEYTSAVAGIRDSIAAGETYQVNFTTRQSFRVSGDHFALYRRMCANQRAPFCAWLDTGSHRILSASPELFFSLKNGLLTMKPMKGTASRKPLNHEDLLQREMLGASSKERAENLMIVDLVRNDLSRIAETGSVEVPSLFEVQTFPTLHQMTSTVTARLRPDTGLVDIFRALFPCGSVTGAPKRRTMEIIREREQSGRGIYCGAIGFVSPGGEAVFSVAIRTAVLESSSGSGSMGIGSGITWDSEPEAEFRECLAKGTFLTRTPAEFKLIESLLHDHNGYLLLERHLLRLEESAEYFGFSFPLDRLRSEFEQLGQTLSGRHKVRVLLTENGDITLEAQEIADSGKFGQQLLVAVAEQRVDSSDPFLYHKTTRRALYDSERRTHPQSGEVIFLNERGEVTEGCFNNIVISRGGELLTPAVGCGLLPGVLREELIEVGAIREAILTLTDISNADRLWLINSVRGWREGIMLKMAQP